MQPTFGASTWLWTSPFDSTQTALIEKIAALGFDTVELPIEDVALVDAKALAPVLAANGLKATVCGAFGPGRDLTDADPAVRANTRAYLSDLMGLAETLGAGFVAGPMYSRVGKARQLPESERQREWDLAVSELRTVSEEAGNRGLAIALEPINRFETDFINTCDQGLEMIHDVGSSALKLHLDTFHMNIEEKDSAAAIRRAGSNLGHLHACGCDRGTPGNDHIDWTSIAKALHDVRYNGDVVIESFTSDVKALARAASIWREIEPTREEIAWKGVKFLQSVLRNGAN